MLCKKRGLAMGMFDGKTVIITGGGFAGLRDGSAGSIGYGIATAFAKEGANLVPRSASRPTLECVSFGFRLT